MATLSINSNFQKKSTNVLIYAYFIISNMKRRRKKQESKRKKRRKKWENRSNKNNLIWTETKKVNLYLQVSL